MCASYGVLQCSKRSHSDKLTFRFVVAALYETLLGVPWRFIFSKDASGSPHLPPPQKKRENLVKHDRVKMTCVFD